MGAVQKPRQQLQEIQAAWSALGALVFTPILQMSSSEKTLPVVIALQPRNGAISPAQSGPVNEEPTLPYCTNTVLWKSCHWSSTSFAVLPPGVFCPFMLGCCSCPAPDGAAWHGIMHIVHESNVHGHILWLFVVEWSAC